jgi:hypothetical protein
MGKGVYSGVLKNKNKKNPVKSCKISTHFPAVNGGGNVFFCTISREDWFVYSIMEVTGTRIFLPERLFSSNTTLFLRAERDIGGQLTC